MNAARNFRRQTGYLGLLHGIFVGFALIIFSLAGFTPNYAQQTVYGDPPPKRVFGELTSEIFVVYAVVGLIIISGTYGGLNYIINRNVRLLVPSSKTEWRHILQTIYQSGMSILFIFLIVFWTSELHQFSLELEKILITMVAASVLLLHLLLLMMCTIGTIFSRQVMPNVLYMILVGVNVVQGVSWVVSISPQAPTLFATNVVSTFFWLICVSLFWVIQTSGDSPVRNTTPTPPADIP